MLLDAIVRLLSLFSRLFAILEGEQIASATYTGTLYMYIVEFALKQTGMPLMVQKKEKDEAESLYKQATEAITSGSPIVLEAACDKVTDKKLTIAVSQLVAVQMYEKTGSAGAGGRAPGFFALAEEE